MNTPSAIAHVVLDFDGTCTQIPKIWEAYLELYRAGLGEAGFDVRVAMTRPPAVIKDGLE